MRLSTVALLLGAIAAPAAPPFAQSTDEPAPPYSLKFEPGSTKAINYAALGGAATVDFRGTSLAPRATGQAKVKAGGGVMQIDAKFAGLGSSSKLGPEYTTFVLWAISPEGRAVNVSEVIAAGGKAKISVTTRLQDFALVVTAEPYYAVTQVGNAVVLENVARGKDASKTEDVRFDRLQSGQYTLNMDPADLQPMPADKKSPPEIYQARNAVKIAKAAAADKFAADAYRKSADLLEQAERMLRTKQSKTKIVPVARQAVQTAEDARQIALKKQAEEWAEQERRAMAARMEQARQAAAESEAQKLEADRARMAAESQAERARREALDAQAAQQEAEKAQLRAEQEKAQLRSQLKDQLNAILETQDTARGLIVNVAGLNFETGKATLLPAVREKLARVSGILLSHPGLKIEVEGHTDSVGSDDFNQKLSEARAASVKDYLVESGVSADAIDSRGFGKTRPVASNDDAKGRQQNRRVEIVVSGEAIAPAGKES